jgi:hypothetical protein
MKNIKDSQGKLVKTICSTDVGIPHMNNRRNCESFNMNMLKLDTPNVETAVLAYANDQYIRSLPGFIVVDGTLGNGWCRCVSNQKTGKKDDYRKHQCGCGDNLFGMCEFKFPRGENI